MRAGRFLAAALLLVATVPPAVAERALPPLDPPQLWRILAPADRDSTSRCIGRPETPLCAVETLLACFQRNRADLCRMVDDKADEYSAAFSSPADPDKNLFYRLVAAESLTGDRAAGYRGARPGDLLLELDQVEGAAGQLPTGTSGPASAFILREIGRHRWKIVAWGDLAL